MRVEGNIGLEEAEDWSEEGKPRATIAQSDVAASLAVSF